MEKIRWTDRVRNEVAHRIKEERNVVKLHEYVFFFFVQHESSTVRSFHLPIAMMQVTAHAPLNPAYSHIKVWV